MNGVCLFVNVNHCYTLQESRFFIFQYTNPTTMQNRLFTFLNAVVSATKKRIVVLGFLQIELKNAYIFFHAFLTIEICYTGRNEERSSQPGGSSL